MRRLPVIAACFLLFAIFPAGCLAQSGSPSVTMSAATDVGVRPMIPYSGTLENVNVTNGNVNITIPILRLRGRNGHDIDLKLIYDSKIWKFTGGYEPDSNSMGGMWEIDQRELDNPLGPGWHLNIPEIFSTDYVDPNTGACMWTYVVTTFTGSKISFKYNCNTRPPAGVIDSDDEVGMRFDFTQNMLSTPDGMRVYFGGTAARKIVDANGNVISLDGGVIKDTLGREIGSLGTNGISYKRDGSTTANITFQYGGVSVHYDFAQPQTTYRSGKLFTYVVNPSGDEGWGELSQVILQNGQSYKFFYNSYGELAAIQYPTGGYTTYEYFPKAETLATVAYTTPIGKLFADFREVKYKRVCPRTDLTPPVTSGVNFDYANDPCAADERVTQYVPTARFASNTTFDVIEPLGKKTQYELSGSAAPGDVTLSGYYAARETKRDLYDGGALLRSVSTTYDSDEPLLPYSWSQIASISTTNDVGQTKQETFTYEAVTLWHQDLPQETIPDPPAVQVNRNLNVKEYKEFGYSGELLRRTTNTWKHDYSGISSPVRLLSLKTEEAIYEGTSQTAAAKTQYVWDDYSSGIQSSNAVQHDSGYGTAYASRGNLTSTKRLNTTTGAWIETRRTYDDAGNVLTITEPATAQLPAATTTFTYGDSATCQCGITGCTPGGSIGAAYITQVQNQQGHLNTYQWDACIGEVTYASDQNSQPTVIERDVLGRVWHATLPGGGEVFNAYSNSIPFVTTAKVKRDPSGNYVVNKIEYDGIGEATHARLCEDGTDGCIRPINTDMGYDLLGRKSSETNPYRSSSDPTFGSTNYLYDALGRVKTVTWLPDNSVLTSVYTGDVTLTTDEAGNQRQLEADALGRLVRVFEPGPGLNHRANRISDELSVQHPRRP